MNQLRAILLMVILALLYGCSNDEYSGTANDRLGPKGEPPAALKLAYGKKFVAEQKHYIRALGEIHAFLLENMFHPHYRQCFTDVLDIRVTADTAKYKETFPCIAFYASVGEMPRIYIAVSVDEVKFNQLDGNNRVTFTVGIYGDVKQDLINKFSMLVEPSLRQLYRP